VDDEEKEASIAPATVPIARVSEPPCEGARGDQASVVEALVDSSRDAILIWLSFFYSKVGGCLRNADLLRPLSHP
jgi:hypothetical protein